jgi:general secretion pathway protein A
MTEQTVFSHELMQEVHVRSQGIPRVINSLCDNLLLTAFAMERHDADTAMLDEVCADMRLEWPGHSLKRGGAPGGVRNHLDIPEF